MTRPPQPGPGSFAGHDLSPTLPKIPCLQLDRVDVEVRLVHVAGPDNWFGLTTVCSTPAMPGFVAATRRNREGPSRPETAFRSVDRSRMPPRSDR